MTQARATFLAIAEVLQSVLQKSERFTATMVGEESDFVRFNHGKLRQAGHVSQRTFNVDLIDGQRHASGQCTISGESATDRVVIGELVAELRGQCALLGDDPHLLYSDSGASLVRDDADTLPTSGDALEHIAIAAKGLDLVGIWANGGIHIGFANSFGQRSWHHVHTFNFNFSSYLQTDRAVKASYAGTAWNAGEFARIFTDVRAQLKALDRTPKTIAPGRYRAYFAPSAVEDLLGMLSWGGFSTKAHRTRTTPLLRLGLGEASFDRQVTLIQDVGGGLMPAFTEEGFRKAERLTLVKDGKLHELMTSPRSAREFKLQPNAGEEAPDSLAMLGGSLDVKDVLKELGTGIFINNVWYCNYSDTNACRITGMTRFACFWVEGGEIVAPLTVMRFDDSMYGLLGDRLLGITAQRTLSLSASSYGNRSLASTLVPGLLVDDLALTL